MTCQFHTCFQHVPYNFRSHLSLFRSVFWWEEEVDTIVSLRADRMKMENPKWILGDNTCQLTRSNSQDSQAYLSHCGGLSLLQIQIKLYRAFRHLTLKEMIFVAVGGALPRPPQSFDTLCQFPIIQKLNYEEKKPYWVSFSLHSDGNETLTLVNCGVINSHSLWTLSLYSFSRLSVNVVSLSYTTNIFWVDYLADNWIRVD